MDSRIRCSRCGGKLAWSDIEANCQSCGETFAITHGVLVQNKTDAYYWSEVPQIVLEDIIEYAASNGWEKGVARLIDEHFPGYRNIVLDLGRANWIYLFEADSVQSVLEIGSGLGQTSYLLASRHGLEVHSLEGTRERALLQGVRKTQEELSNLVVVNADYFDARFEEGAFDIVTFIGVLEWLGVADRHPSPRDVQVEALARARTYLRDGGHVCVGIENRMGINNFLGAIDHSGLRFTSLMPRWMANAYIRLRRPSFMTNAVSTSYRTYTYTAAGYKRLLTDAGFKDIRLMVAHPHYARPYCLVGMDATGSHFRLTLDKMYKPRSVKDYIVTKLMVGLSYLGLGAWMAPNFFVIGEK